jgi:two-component system, response regulator YesN
MPLPLENILTYVDRHTAMIRSLADVAHAFQIPEETLRKTFRKSKGIPFGQYLRAKRVEQAKWLLAETHLYIYEVCRHVGWSEDTGREIFQRETGQTMGQYRKMARAAAAGNP